MSSIREALYYTLAADKKLTCDLCPHVCVITDNHTGRCRVRARKGDRLDLPYYGMISSIASDPIEKKPLYHFFPGTQILSVGFWGCNFHCPFCQNFSISQNLASQSDFLSPAELVDLAKNRGSFAIAYTYSEPLIHFEYVLDCARLARAAGLKNVLVTNGFINEKPALELMEVIDAANVDLKTFNPDFYRVEIGGGLEGVKRFIELAAKKIVLEVTTLVIPTKNDSAAEIEAITAFLAALSCDIPYHLSCYYPTYKYSIRATTAHAVTQLAALARQKLHYVYEGNVGVQETNTYCPGCNNLLIHRRGYTVSLPGVKNGTCSQCSREIPIPGLP